MYYHLCNKVKWKILSEFVKVAHNMLHEKKGPGSDYLGWVTLPHDYDKEEFSRIKKAAERIRQSF